MHVNILDMGRRGALAAMLPGLLAAFLGWPGYFIGGVASAALVAVSSSIKFGLTSLVWYRWYFGVILTATLAMGTTVWLRPPFKETALLTWALCVVITLVVSAPLMLRAARTELPGNTK